MRKSRVAAFAFLLVLVAAGGAGWIARDWYLAPLPLPTSPFDFEVKAGASLASVARRLQEAGVLPHAAALT